MCMEQEHSGGRNDQMLMHGSLQGLLVDEENHDSRLPASLVPLTSLCWFDAVPIERSTQGVLKWLVGCLTSTSNN